MKKISKILRRTTIKQPKTLASSNDAVKPWLELLMDQPEIAKDAEHRIAMTTGCRDCDYIPKVKDAGKIKKVGKKEYQVMHNGLLVEAGGYFGDWMVETIKSLKGHHEPQEEKAFYEILKHIPNNSVMIELGSYWSYYSMWFNKATKGAVNYCCEPDPVNLKLGMRNSDANKLDRINFISAAAGSDDGKEISFKPQEGDRDPVTVKVKSIDGLVSDEGIERLELVHMDVQGAELEALKGAEQSIKKGVVRFVFVSTHHYLISEDTRLHEKCIEYIEELGGHIIVEHAIHESFSGDGLIVASFFDEDVDIKIEISDNRMDNGLFRSYTKDMDILIDAYESLRKQYEGYK